MRKHHNNLSSRLVITRHFESSRHQVFDVITAFERALPIVRRTVGRSPRPSLKQDLSPLQRRASS